MPTVGICELLVAVRSLCMAHREFTSRVVTYQGQDLEEAPEDEEHSVHHLCGCMSGLDPAWTKAVI